MKLICLDTPEELGRKAAEMVRECAREVIAEKGHCRIVFSTGASQFTTFEALLKTDIDWSKVEMFHLDEYVGLPEAHPASFRRYLHERLVDRVPLKSACLINGEADVETEIQRITEELRKEPIDIGLIGIGENAHIAFNDPPADTQTDKAYFVVKLPDRCKQQQVGEGWFATKEEVPQCAITMTVPEIMKISKVISCVPYAVKADAIRKTFMDPISNQTPSTWLRRHPGATVLVDRESVALLPEEQKAAYEEGRQE